MILYILIIPEVLFAALLLFAEFQRNYRGALLFKTLSSLVFVAAGFCALRTRTADLFTRLILTGLVLGAVGDFFLSLRHVMDDRDVFFYIGGSIFFLGHLAYLAALSGVLLKLGVLRFAIPASLLAAAVLIVLLLKKIRADRRFSFLCAGYMCAVTSVAVFGIFRFFAAPYSLGNLLFMIGGIFFASSDTILVENMWNERQSFRKGCTLIILYYAAQFMIACSLSL